MSDAKGRLDTNEVSDITQQLNDGRLSRNGLRQRLMGLGIGFGAAFVLGLTGAQASTAPEIDRRAEVDQSGDQRHHRLRHAG